MPNLILDEEHKYNFETDVFGNFVKVRGREHYKKLMAQGGYVPFEKAQEIAHEARKKTAPKLHTHDPELVSFLRHLKMTSTKDGKVMLGGKAIQKMKEFGVNFDALLPSHLKEHPLKGGIDSD